MLVVKEHVNSVFSSVSYLLADGRECWLIDVGDYREIKPMLARLTLKGVLLTHVHFDHIYGLNELLKDYPEVEIYTNEFGKRALYNPSENLSIYHEMPFVLDDKAKVNLLKEGDEISIGKSTMKVYETPGHDPSCLCFCVYNYLFTGDAYIPGVKVFTKFQNADKVKAAESVKRIIELAKEKAIFAGHKI